MAQPVKKKIQKANSAAAKKQPAKVSVAPKQEYLAALLAILVISFIAYLPALHGSFVNWDDDKYIQGNALIETINLKKLFSTYVMGNYHPITMLVYALEYHFFGLSETGFHAVSLLFHLANVVLVFYVILMLSNKTVVALVASLLFGIHPLHVESVAWASSLKDLLYTFFFLASYICYLKYLKNKENKFFLYALLLYLFSILSKAMAVPLPAVFLLTDYLMKRKLNAKAWLEKVPFFALGLIFGVVAVFAQKSTSSIQSLTVIPFYQRIIFACYDYITYLAKLFIPFNLSAFYPYPIDTGQPVPSQYYIYPVILIALVAIVFYSLRYSRKVIFGIGFFTLTVLLVLQLLPVGDAIMADRYSYIPSIGIFYLAGEGFYWLWNKKKGAVNLKWPAAALLGLFAIFFTVKTYAQCGIWENGLTLWTDVISKYKTIPSSYNNRGVLLMGDKRYDEALSDYNKAIELKPDYAMAYNDRGLLFVRKERYDEALSDYNKAIRLEPQNESSYTNRGIILAMKKDYEGAIKDFDKAIELHPDNPEGYANRALSLQNENRLTDAMKDYDKVIELKPNSPQALYNRAVIEFNTGQKETGCADFQQAAKLGFSMAEDTYNKICH